MFDKDLILRICDAECSPEELGGFVADIDNKEFDAEEPFEKYYRLERILSVIERYREKKITDGYFSDWAAAYKWIVMGGFDESIVNTPVCLKKLIVWQICDWLDSMETLRIKCEYDLYRFEKAFGVLDRAYRESDGCEWLASHVGVRENDMIALVKNTQNKYFLKIYSNVKYVNEKLDIELVPLEELRAEINGLTDSGYTELIYGIFDDSEFD